MTQLNQIIIEGNLGADPEMKMFKEETLATFSLAHTPRTKVNGQYEDGDTTWFRVTFWNSKSDAVLENLKKGDRVMVIGKLNQSTYTNKSGEVKTSLEIAGSAFYLTAKTPARQAPMVHANQQDFMTDLPNMTREFPNW
jgi:single stranded DNA-binding protein